MSDAGFMVDLQRDGASIGVYQLADYVALPAESVADTVACIFSRCEACGRRNDHGTRGEVSRAIGAAAADFSRSKVAR